MTELRKWMSERRAYWEVKVMYSPSVLPSSSSTILWKTIPSWGVYSNNKCPSLCNKISASSSMNLAYYAEWWWQRYNLQSKGFSRLKCPAFSKTSRCQGERSDGRGVLSVRMRFLCWRWQQLQSKAQLQVTGLAESSTSRMEDWWEQTTQGRFLAMCSLLVWRRMKE